MLWWWLACAWPEEPAVVPPHAAASVAPPCPASLADGDPRLFGPATLVAWKADRRIGLYRQGKLATLEGAPACFPMGLAPGSPPGPKREEGDLKTPEGWYRTSDKPTSRFAHAIAVHYPNADDAAAGLAAGLIDARTAARITSALRAGHKPPQDTALGGEILVHAGGAWDWTLGCVALDDEDLLTLRAGLPAGMATDLLMLP
jgi:hypothetical protein